MGNPGCFYKFHSNGKARKKHSTLPLELNDDGYYEFPKVDDDPYAVKTK